MKNIKSFASLLVLALATSAAAQTAAAAQGAPAQPEKKRQHAPEGTAPKAFKVPATVDFNLPNGMKVTMVQYGKVPKLNIVAQVRTGNIDEAADQVWLADFTGELMKEGTRSLGAKEVAQRAASMGGAVTVTVGPDQTSVAADGLSEYAPDIVKLLADVIQNPLLPSSEVARIQGDLVRRMKVQLSRPQTMALERFRQVLYPQHPYGRLYPTEAMIQGYTAEKARAFYDANVGAQRTHLYVAGNFDQAAVRKAIEGAFGSWKQGSAAKTNPPQAVPKKVAFIINRAGAAQSTVLMGLPIVDPSHTDYMNLRVMNAMLGGSFGSRITANIRENKGYTYSPFSTMSARYRDAYWAQQADVTTAVTGPSISEILKEIDRLSKEPPSAAELKGIQNYLAGVFVIQNSSRGGIIGQLNFRDLHGLPKDYLETYVQKIYAATPQQVQAMTAKYIKPDQMTLVIVGDEAKIKDQVAPYLGTAPSPQQ